VATRQAETNFALSFAPVTVSFDPDAFDLALASQGVKYVHYRSFKCPVGLTDRFDQRATHDDHSGCSNGHQYVRAGIVTGIFTSNNMKSDQSDIGLLDGSTVQVTLPRTYDDCDGEVMVSPFDRFYLCEENVTVPHQQLVEAHITGTDKLSFPAVKVYDAMDSAGKKYGPDDFSIDNLGRIVWKGGGPGFNEQLQKGNVYSIRYTYRPFWYVDRLIHEVRIAQVDTGVERQTIRMPQSFSLNREYVYEKARKDTLAPNPDDPRQVKSPRQGVFAPR
jgi:hypothetical protein